MFSPLPSHHQKQRQSWEQGDDCRSMSFSSSSVRSSVSVSSAANERRPFSALVMSSNKASDTEAVAWLPDLLRKFIVHRCALNDHCRESDFDQSALEALSRVPFLQAMQTVEHFSSSVSNRIQKKAAYLMGILKGQESHWEKFGTALAQSNGMMKGRELVDMPAEVLLFVGRSCLTGNMLPSDFTPEVCLSLHGLVLPLAVKAISAFNTNKRIIAGAKGGIVNRARFFLKLIQNIIDQSSPSSHAEPQYDPRQALSSPNSPSSSTISHDDLRWDELTKDLNEDVSNLSLGSSFIVEESKEELSLEQLADLQFERKSPPPVEQEAKLSQQISILQREVQFRAQREHHLLAEVEELRHRVKTMQREYLKMRSFLRLQ